MTGRLVVLCCGALRVGAGVRLRLVGALLGARDGRRALVGLAVRFGVGTGCKL
jgi:hypothetical protein